MNASPSVIVDAVLVALAILGGILCCSRDPTGRLIGAGFLLFVFLVVAAILPELM